MRAIVCAIALLVAVTGSARTAEPGQNVLRFFQSPTGNIDCLIASTSVECLVRQSSWPSVLPKPADCDVDWDPHTVSTDGRHVRVGSCRGDPGPTCADHPDRYHRCPVLAYGHSITVGRLRCTSSARGMTCRSRFGKRHGFRIAREAVATF